MHEDERTLETVLASVKEQFDGRDVIADCHTRMQMMDQQELIKLLLIACNRVGVCMKGSDYETPYDAAFYLSAGMEAVFNAHDSACGLGDSALEGNA